MFGIPQCLKIDNRGFTSRDVSLRKRKKTMLKALSCIFLVLFVSQLVCGQEDFAERKYTKENKVDWALSVEFNTGLGILDVESVTMGGLQSIYGASFSEKFIIGAGTGIHLYEDERFVPLYLEGRYMAGQGPTRFLLGTSLGAYSALDGNGWERYINPFMGFTYEGFEHVALTVSIGLVYKDYEVRLEPVRLLNGGFANIAGTEEIVGRFFSLRFGCLF